MNKNDSSLSGKQKSIPPGSFIYHTKLRAPGNTHNAIINDIPVIDNKIWVASCIGMAIADFWTIFVAFKAKKEISKIVGYEEITWNHQWILKNPFENIIFVLTIFYTLNKYFLLVNPDDSKKILFIGWCM